jgi:hypothetical protein
MRAMVCRGLIALVALGTMARGASLADRRAAIDRALSFLEATAATDANVARYGNDLLWCFYTISHTSRDRRLRTQARQMARDLARRWRKMHPHVPADASARDIYRFVVGAYTADRLGFRDARFKEELRQAAGRFTAQDYLGFDAAHESPRLDDPKRYDVFTDALIRSYFGDAYGITLGAHHRDVVGWLPRLRPYDGNDEDTEFDIFYAISHVIYTANGYHERRINPSLLPQEFQFLRRKLAEAIDDADPEMVAEALDCLKAAGFEHDPQVLAGMEYLVSSQRTNGSWAGDDDDLYTQYHSAWAGIDGLREYRYRGE